MGRKYGYQQPRIEHVPAYAYSDGADAAQLVKAYGYSLDPWQKKIITAWLGRDKNDRFTATSCGLSVPRQNGKNALLEVRELYGLVVMQERILHTAHEVKTARQAFTRLMGFFTKKDKYPELANMVDYIRKGNGQEEIALTNGASILFSSRTNGAHRGFTVDSVMFDEAQELTDEQLNALLPTLAAAPSGNRQFIYTGTPPATGPRGEVFRRVRQSAIDKIDKKCAWHEWSIARLPKRDVTVDELENLAMKTNPAMGYRLTREFTRQQAIQMSLDGFSRECLGWWSATATGKAISEGVWTKTFIKPKEVPQDGLKTFGVKFSADGQHVALAGCKHKTDNPLHVELIFYKPIHEGLGSIIEFFNDTKRQNETAGIAIDGRSGTGALINALLGNYPKQAIMTAGTKGCVDASVMFEQALYEKDITHTNTDDGAQDDLTRAVLNAIKRPIGREGGWIYGGAASEPLEACTLAVWANKTTKIDPARRALVW